MEDTTQKGWRVVITCMKSALVFLAVGPLIGAFLLSTASALVNLEFSPSGLSAWVMTMVVGVPFAYVIGGIPSFLAGAIFASVVMVAKKKSTRAKVLIGAFSGAVAFTAAYIVHDKTPLTLLTNGDGMAYILTGVGLSAVVALLLRRRLHS
ncbi:hypothetical protein [Pseudomonas sp. BN411]|uniref:hypothetical protein n=1 Tax=Pseudomonas sp. BN411 TaxID=2567887 RepID=UPI00245453D9|nr:hypothetical protein [Pseudomonas sp. BN411]MDH4562148.1 hypothetical protein [Pseudomonas sp. BN411]